MNHGVRRQLSGPCTFLLYLFQACQRQLCVAGMYLLFDLHDVVEDYVKTNLTFLVCFFFKHPQYRKINAQVEVYRWEILPGVSDRVAL